jgi:hypothetical protein
MSCNAYQSSMQNLTQRYARFPDNLGLLSYGQYYSMTPQVSQTLTAGQQQAFQANPVGLLYQSGASGLQMLSAGSSDCEQGCFGYKSDPRNQVVKPLYQGSQYQYYQAQREEPTSQNVQGIF